MLQVSAVLGIAGILIVHRPNVAPCMDCTPSYQTEDLVCYFVSVLAYSGP